MWYILLGFILWPVTGFLYVVGRNLILEGTWLGNYSEDFALECLMGCIPMLILDIGWPKY